MLTWRLDYLMAKNCYLQTHRVEHSLLSISSDRTHRVSIEKMPLCFTLPCHSSGGTINKIGLNGQLRHHAHHRLLS